MIVPSSKSIHWFLQNHFHVMLFLVMVVIVDGQFVSQNSSLCIILSSLAALKFQYLHIYMFFHPFYKGNFCEFLLASLESIALSKQDQLWKERICSWRSKFFHIRVYSHLKGKRTLKCFNLSPIMDPFTVLTADSVDSDQTALFVIQTAQSP